MTHDDLVCPETRLPLRRVALEDAERAAGAALVARADGPPAIGPTPTVLLREDRAVAYPIVDDISVLLAPEQLAARGRTKPDPSQPRYAEAYDEMVHYNHWAESELAHDLEASYYADFVAKIAAASASTRACFPDPRRLWIDAIYDAAAQYESYAHLAPLAGRRVLQLGGSGVHAAKFLLGGATDAWVLTPMIAEAQWARALAQRLGLDDRLGAVVGIAEELPLKDATVDGIYAGGTVHHMTTDVAFAECARVLTEGGRFAAAEPWRAPFYRLGTRMLGQREPASCQPLTHDRLDPLDASFDSSAVVHHGALTRYPLLGLAKLGLPVGLNTAWRVTRLDDAAASVFPPLRRRGSSVVLLGTKTGLRTRP